MLTLKLKNFKKFKNNKNLKKTEKDFTETREKYDIFFVTEKTRTSLSRNKGDIRKTFI